MKEAFSVPPAIYPCHALAIPVHHRELKRLTFGITKFNDLILNKNCYEEIQRCNQFILHIVRLTCKEGIMNE